MDAVRCIVVTLQRNNKVQDILLWEAEHSVTGKQHLHVYTLGVSAQGFT